MQSEFESNYKGIQKEVHSIIERSDNDIYELQFDESKLSTLNMELSKLLSFKESGLAHILSPYMNTEVEDEKNNIVI